MSRETEKSSVTVRIAGEEHTIRSSAGADYTQECASYVDGAITEIRDLGRVDHHRAAILAALSITDQYFRARDRADEVQHQLDERAERLIERIEQAIES